MIACGGATIYAIVEAAGKQYKVTPGQTIQVDYLRKMSGSTLELDRVLLIASDDKVITGTPVVEGAKVIATVQGGGIGRKVRVFKYKAKVRYRRNTGHRQPFTRLSIDQIIVPGAETA